MLHGRLVILRSGRQRITCNGFWLSVIANRRETIVVPFRSVRSLYPLALAEGEGIGTAYEYFAKRLVLARWLARLPRPERLLIAGLPEKYGSSLDFFLLAQEMGVASVLVIDDRPSAIEKIRQSLAAAQASGELARVQPQYVLVTDLSRLNEVSDGFDLCLGSEVLQRLGTLSRQNYVARLAQLASALALFAPNADDPNHTTLSGLSGLRLTELQALVEPGLPVHTGYVDMPPFPPGMTRSAEKRNRAAHSRLEGLAMWGLGYYARLETYFPSEWRRRHSHIVCAFIEKKEMSPDVNSKCARLRAAP